MAYLPFAFARAAIINVLNGAESEQVDAIPENFNNNIRWNAGHALVVADRILHHAEQYGHTIPSHFKEFFSMGTSPADWKEEPPSVAEISRLSKEQLEATAKLVDTCDIQAKLENVFDLRGTKFSTISELLGFLAYHEGMHYDTTKLLLRITDK